MDPHLTWGRNDRKVDSSCDRPDESGPYPGRLLVGA